MRRNFARVSTLVGGIALGSLVASAFAVACGGDDSAPIAGADATKDGFVPDANFTDIALVDSADASPPLDSPVEDAADLLSFSGRQVAALCDRLATCCFGLDAGAFDTAHCVSAYLGIGGWHSSLKGLAVADGGPGPLLARGNLLLDTNSAQSCIAGLKTENCPAQTATEYRNIQQNCFGAVFGTIPIGQAGCIDSIECTPGAYCVANPDGGAGTCAAILGSGGACGLDYSACEYRGIEGAQHCEVYSYVDGSAPSNTCIPNVPLGSTCNTDRECTNGVCGALYTCASSATVSTPGLCAILTKDGG